MKSFLFLTLFCTSLHADETGVRVACSAITNIFSGQVRKTEVFTRDGQTNLVRETSPQVGIIQTFYYDGARVATFVSNTQFSIFHNEPSARYSVDLTFSPSNKLQCATINLYGTNELNVDIFGCTDGYFYPLPDSEISNINALRKMGVQRRNNAF